MRRLPPTKRVGFDITPYDGCSEIQVANFLDLDMSHYLPPEGPILTIGNPPFGRRASLANKFIRKAAQYSDVIAFILPRSFTRETMHSAYPPNFHLVKQVLLDCAFSRPDGTGLQLPTVFQVWEKRGTVRKMPANVISHPDLALRHVHISRVSRARLKEIQDEYTYAIPQVGGDFFARASADLTQGSYWFVKPATPRVADILLNTNFAPPDGEHAAVKSLSRAEIIAAYARSLQSMSLT